MRYRDLVVGRSSDRPVVLVTGASGRLGRSICATLARRARIAAQGAAHPEALGGLAAEIARAGGDLRVYAADLDAREAVGGLLERVSRDFGSAPAAIVHAASPAPPVRLADDTPAAAERMFRVNVLALWRLIELASLPMRYAQRGVVIGVSSEAILGPPVPGWTGYTTAKLAMTGVLAASARELEGTGVRLLAVAPGALTPDPGRETPEARMLAAIRARWPLGLEPDRVAGLVDRMIGDPASYPSGAHVAVNAIEGERALAPIEAAPAAAAEAPTSPAPTATASVVPGQSRLDAIVRRVLGIPPERSLEDLRLGLWEGWDSLRHLSLLMAVEESFGVDFSSMDASRLASYRDLRAAVFR